MTVLYLQSNVLRTPAHKETPCVRWSCPVGGKYQPCERSRNLRRGPASGLRTQNLKIKKKKPTAGAGGSKLWILPP